MDLVSHALWTAMLATTIKRKIIPLKTSKTVFWGIFPDLFSFVLPALFLFLGSVAGKVSFSDLPRSGGMESASLFANRIFGLILFLYSISHSLIIFLTATIILYVSVFMNRRMKLSSRFQKFPLEMSGWALHILIDIPTHSIGFFATPFLFPFSDWKFDGLSWRTPWFLVLNYSVMIILYLVFFKKSEKVNKNIIEKIKAKV